MSQVSFPTRMKTSDEKFKTTLSWPGVCSVIICLLHKNRTIIILCFMLFLFVRAAGCFSAEELPQPLFTLIY